MTSNKQTHQFYYTVDPRLSRQLWAQGISKCLDNWIYSLLSKLADAYTCTLESENFGLVSDNAKLKYQLMRCAESIPIYSARNIEIG